MPNGGSTRLGGMLFGMGLVAILAALLHYSIALSLGWGMSAGVFFGIALESTRTCRERVLCGILAVGIVVAAVWLFGSHPGA